MTDTASGRPPQLDDPAWLASKLATDGTMAIALELGVSRKVVRTACEAHGLRPGDHGNGRRRGTSTRPARLTVDSPTLDLIRERLTLDVKRRTPATEEQFAERLRALHDAKANGSAHAEEDAWIDLASVCGLIHQHQRQLRRAA